MVFKKNISIYVSSTVVQSQDFKNEKNKNKKKWFVIISYKEVEIIAAELAIGKRLKLVFHSLDKLVKQKLVLCKEEYVKE